VLLYVFALELTFMLTTKATEEPRTSIGWALILIAGYVLFLIGTFQKNPGGTPPKT